MAHMSFDTTSKWMGDLNGQTVKFFAGIETATGKVHFQTSQGAYSLMTDTGLTIDIKKLGIPAAQEQLREVVEQFLGGGKKKAAAKPEKEAKGADADASKQDEKQTEETK